VLDGPAGGGGHLRDDGVCERGPGRVQARAGGGDLLGERGDGLALRLDDPGDALLLLLGGAGGHRVQRGLALVEGAAAGAPRVPGGDGLLAALHRGRVRPQRGVVLLPGQGGGEHGPGLLHGLLARAVGEGLLELPYARGVGAGPARGLVGAAVRVAALVLGALRVERVAGLQGVAAHGHEPLDLGAEVRRREHRGEHVAEPAGVPGGQRLPGERRHREATQRDGRLLGGDVTGEAGADELAKRLLGAGRVLGAVLRAHGALPLRALRGAIQGATEHRGLARGELDRGGLGAVGEGVGREGLPELVGAPEREAGGVDDGGLPDLGGAAELVGALGVGEGESGLGAVGTEAGEEEGGDHWVTASVAT
jgi:hypothetical protein